MVRISTVAYPNSKKRSLDVEKPMKKYRKQLMHENENHADGGEIWPIPNVD